MTYAIIFISFLIFVVTIAAFMLLTTYEVSRYSSRGITKRLVESGTALRLRLTTMRSSWNPDKPYSATNRIYGPGTAEYTLDDSGIVHLTLHKNDGSVHNYNGPIPSVAREDPLERRRTKKIIRRARLVQLALLLLGYSVAFLLARGPTFERLDFGIVGFLVAMFLTIIVLRITAVAISIRRVVSSRNADDKHEQ